MKKKKKTKLSSQNSLTPSASVRRCSDIIRTRQTSRDMIKSAENGSLEEDTQAMIKMIEIVLGNPISKRLLRFCTKRCSCGRRIEIAMRCYVGDISEEDRKKLCLGCRTATYFMRKIIDFFIKRLNVDIKDAEFFLKDSVWRKGLASMIEGIAMYGPQKPFTGYSPFLIVWNITRACNLFCKHCYEESRTARPDELTTAQKLEAVDKMADAGIAYIAISGGEPLLLLELETVARRIKERGMGFSVATNATLLTKEKARMLKKYDCLFVQISLDGATAKTHNSFRGANAFQRTITGIKNAIAADLDVGISATVTKYNINELPKIIGLAEKLGAYIFMHYNFIPVGRGREIMHMDIEPEKREALLSYLANESGKRKIKILSTAPQYSRVCMNMNCGIPTTHFDIFSTDIDGEKIRFLAEFIGGCGAGRLYCALEPNGDIEPCVFIPIKLGNIMTDNFVDIWQNHSVLKKMRDRKGFKGNCGVCEHRNVCGGCRARAYGYYGDVSECDPGCIKNKEEWEKLAKG